MTARILDTVSACLADWSILVIGNPMPPRDPNDDDDDDDENEDEDDDAESNEEKPAVIREPDE